MGPQKSHMPLSPRLPGPVHSFPCCKECISRKERQRRRCSQHTGGKGYEGEAAVATCPCDRRHAGGHEEEHQPRYTSPTRKTPARTGQEASPANSGNDGVADEASGKLAKPPSPPAPTPAAGAAAEEVVALLAEKDAEIRDLQAQVEEPTRKTQVDKHKEEPKKKAARITMSTEVAGVP